MYVTAVDVIGWASLTVAPTDIELVAVVAAVNAHVASNYDVPAPADYDPGVAHADLAIALRIQAHKLWKRRATPEGVTQFDGVAALRISRFDPDVEAMISPRYDRLPGCA